MNFYGLIKLAALAGLAGGLTACEERAVLRGSRVVGRAIIVNASYDQMHGRDYRQTRGVYADGTGYWIRGDRRYYNRNDRWYVDERYARRVPEAGFPGRYDEDRYRFDRGGNPGRFERRPGGGLELPSPGYLPRPGGGFERGDRPGGPFDRWPNARFGALEESLNEVTVHLASARTGHSPASAIAAKYRMPNTAARQIVSTFNRIARDGSLSALGELGLNARDIDRILNGQTLEASAVSQMSRTLGARQASLKALMRDVHDEVRLQAQGL